MLYIIIPLEGRHNPPGGDTNSNCFLHTNRPHAPKNTGRQPRQNVIITATMRISTLLESDKGVQVVKLFLSSFRFLYFFLLCVRFHTKRRFSKNRINKGKNKKHPGMSKPKGFRSLRAFQCPEKGICTNRCLAGQICPAFSYIFFLTQPVLHDNL